MRRKASEGFWLLMTAWITTQGCSGATPVPLIERPPAVTAGEEEIALAEACNGDFAIDLYRQLAKERPGENLFFSPFSVSSALLIATEGASGETAEQMGKVLCVRRAAARHRPGSRVPAVATCGAAQRAGSYLLPAEPRACFPGTPGQNRTAPRQSNGRE